MITIGILLALVSSLAWAGFDATRKKLTGRIDATPLVVLLTAGQVPLFLGLLWLQQTPLVIADGYFWPAFWTVSLNIAANLLFVTAVRISPLSVTIPMLSFTPVFTALVAQPLLGEVPSPREWLGILIVVGGAFLLNLRRDDLRSPRAWALSLLRERGALLMLVVALLWSITSTVDKMGMERSSLAFHALIQVSGVSGGLLLWLLLRRQVRSLGQACRTPGLLVSSIAFGTLALGFQLAAYETLHVSLVEALKRAVGMSAAVVLGRLFFRESMTAFRLVGIAIMLAGTLLLLL